jgi:hypothetical protein
VRAVRTQRTGPLRPSAAIRRRDHRSLHRALLRRDPRRPSAHSSRRPAHSQPGQLFRNPDPVRERDSHAAARARPRARRGRRGICAWRRAPSEHGPPHGTRPGSSAGRGRTGDRSRTPSSTHGNAARETTPSEPPAADEKNLPDPRGETRLHTLSAADSIARRAEAPSGSSGPHCFRKREGGRSTPTSIPSPFSAPPPRRARSRAPRSRRAPGQSTEESNQVGSGRPSTDSGSRCTDSRSRRRACSHCSGKRSCTRIAIPGCAEVQRCGRACFVRRHAGAGCGAIRDWSASHAMTRAGCSAAPRRGRHFTQL